MARNVSLCVILVFVVILGQGEVEGVTQGQGEVEGVTQGQGAVGGINQVLDGVESVNQGQGAVEDVNQGLNGMTSGVNTADATDETELHPYSVDLHPNEALKSNATRNGNKSQHKWTLSVLDLAVVVVYLAGSLGLGLWCGWRKKGGTEEYFLAGRSSNWVLIGLSIFASNISSSTLVGLAGDAYAYGIAVYSYEWTAALILAVIAPTMVPGLVRSQVFTIPELLHCMYNPSIRYYFSALTVILNIVVETAGTLYAGAVLLRVLLPGWSLWHVIAVLAGVAGLYTVTGGLAAVIITDAVQAVLLGVGSVATTVWAIGQAGGWKAMISSQPSGYVSLIRPLDDPSVPWLGLPGVVLLSVFYFTTNQFMTQRLLSAKNAQEGQKGLVLAAFLKLPVLITMVIPGLAARVIYPDLPRPDLVYPTLMFDLLPPGMLGIVLAGFLAALMSQLDSTLNAVSTLITMDFVRMVCPLLSTSKLRLIGQGVTVLVMVVAVAWAPQIQHFPSLFQYLQRIMSYTSPPILAVYLIGFFWSSATPFAASLTLLFGTLFGITLFLVNEIFHLTHLHFLYIPPILFVFSSVVLISFSIVGKKDTQRDRITLWSLESCKEETLLLRQAPIWQNYRLYCCFLVLAIAVIVGVFW